MPVIAILLTVFLEHKKLLTHFRKCFQLGLDKYVGYFSKYSVNNQRDLRFIYLFACAPIAIVLFLVKLLLVKHYVIYEILNIILFIFTVQILAWKDEAKEKNSANNHAFITTFATRFFVPLFWFLILPSAIGTLCYLIIVQLSNNLKAKNLDSMIYNLIIDKMLFYSNIIPYTILFIFIALAGNLEEVTHYLLAQRKEYMKSNYQLENILNKIVLIAIGKDKFQIGSFERYIEGFEADAGSLDDERFNPEITNYIVAILYRAGLFFIGIVTLFYLANLF